MHGSRSKILSKKSRPYIYDIKFLALLGAPYIYDISRLRVKHHSIKAYRGMGILAKLGALLIRKTFQPITDYLYY
jgi:hypothetical protein